MGIEAIKIDKNSKLPKYKQLSEQIENLIMSGELSPGEKLPTERLLEEITGISRGTIKAAYYELQKTGRIKTIQGSGSFVTEYTHEEAKKMAEESVEKLFKQMQVLELTLPEIEHIFQKQLDKRYEYSKRVKVAWVDCCVECLSIISDQLEPMRSISLETYLLDEVLENPKILPNEYDLLVTTSRHFDALAPLLPDKLERMEKVTLDLKMATVIELVKIPADARVALWSISDTFVPIMHELLRNFDNLSQVTDFVGEENLDEVREGLKEVDVLLVPPAYISLQQEGMIQVIHEFETKGGRIVMFEYQLNKGSLIHFEDRTYDLFRKKNRGEKIFTE